MGEVYTARVWWRRAMAMAYSATTVLPADVCAATDKTKRRKIRSMGIVPKVGGYVQDGGVVARTEDALSAFQPQDGLFLEEIEFKRVLHGKARTQRLKLCSEHCGSDHLTDSL